MSYTYYDYLELSPGATQQKIESAFLTLVERFGYGTTAAGQDMTGLLRMIQTAYDVLSNPESRDAYDAKLADEAASADAELKAALDELAAAAYHRSVQDLPASLQHTAAIAA